MMNRNVFVKMAEHHEELTAEHDQMHKFVKGKHEAMDDDHEHNAYFAKVSAHHEKCMKLHKAHGEFLRVCAEGAPIDNQADAGDGLKMTTEEFLKQFGFDSSTVVPLGTRAVAPSDESLAKTAGAGRLIPRAGQELPADKCEEILNKAFPGAFE
jgi:hypothetical protein